MIKEELDKVAVRIATSMKADNSFVLSTIKHYLPLYLQGYITNDELITQITIACVADTEKGVLLFLSRDPSSEDKKSPLISSSEYSRGEFVMPKKDKTNEA